MKKLKLNKKTISVLDKSEMNSLNGGRNTSIVSCKRSKRLSRSARCCGCPY